ncbi:hypothetical protein MYX78_03785 [Acidobacteria bacterium AH-259-G07]|nr:hypothetical protein [Acidobacteria bacterium AH-259-G07]
MLQRKHEGTKGRVIRLISFGLVALFVGFLFVASVESRSDGAFIPFNNGVLGLLGGTPCFVSGCHNASGGTFNMGGSVVFNNLPASFVPGQTYDIGITITGGTLYGFQ